MASEYEKHPYDDIIDLPHHRSSVHPHMSMHDRAGQFSPFAALTGHEEAINETARYTDSQIELSDEVKAKINEQLQEACRNIGSGEKLNFTYFVPDERKKGGAYVEHSGNVKKIDAIEGVVLLTDRTAIPINRIINIEECDYN